MKFRSNTKKELTKTFFTVLNGLAAVQQILQVKRWRDAVSNKI
jgi:hypothetical protein